MDYDELIVHVFLEETRQFYNLERLWSRAPCIAFEEQEGRKTASGNHT